LKMYYLCTMILRAYKYRLYPNTEQEILINKSIGCSRFIYNWGLDLKIKEYQQNNNRLSYFDLCYRLANLKLEHEWLAEVDSQSIQASLRRLDNGFKCFFREKKGFPKCKSKHKNRASFCIPNNKREIDF